MTVYTEKKNCMGCGACANVCGADALTMRPDDKGFMYPITDETRCVSCGLCRDVCPCRDDDGSRTPERTPVASDGCFAVRLKNAASRRSSSSGGAAYGLSLSVIESGGVVYGAAYDTDLDVKHIRVDSVGGLDRLRGSKYVQSEQSAILQEVECDLKRGTTVLYIGMPCQIAGLKAFLGRSYRNLVTAELICHGVPSGRVWKKYIDEEMRGIMPCDVNMRDKISGWNSSSFTLSRNGKVIRREALYKNSYTFAFLMNYSLRESCFSCAFKSRDRCADLTLGDCWGLDKLLPELAADDGDGGGGMSEVFVNTAVGAALVDACSDMFDMYRLDPDDAILNNLMLVRSVVPPDRVGRFWERLDGEKLKSITRSLTPRDPFILRVKKKLYPIKAMLTGKK